MSCCGKRGAVKLYKPGAFPAAILTDDFTADGIKIKLVSRLFAAVSATAKLGHKARDRHKPQLGHSLYRKHAELSRRQIIKRIEHQPQRFAVFNIIGDKHETQLAYVLCKGVFHNIAAQTEEHLARFGIGYAAGVLGF